jgi:23S rRNA (uracil1939-C5)-methyltransferase
VTAAVRIARIAAGGDGVGRLPDGRVVFVPRTAPGDLVEVESVRSFGRYARGTLVRILEPAPDRAPPRCQHYDVDRCGGCQLQHLDATAQRSVRRTIVGDALRRLAGLDMPDPPLEPSPADWHYRTRITVARDAAGRGLGFRVLDCPDRVFPLLRCEVAVEPINALWRTIAGAGIHWPEGMERVRLRQARDGTLHLICVGRTRPAPHLVTAVAAAGAAVWWQSPRGPVRSLAGPVDPSAVVFEQVHPVMGDRVRHRAVEWLGEVSGQQVWDLYSGVGDATRLLANRGAVVDSVERDRTAVALAARLAGAEGLRDRVRHHAAAVERILTRLAPPHAVLANPPRRGLGRQVVERLLAASPAVMVYVSCDPATLARDLRWLAVGYRVTHVTAFDLFPQTAHVETAVRLERR